MKVAAFNSSGICAVISVSAADQWVLDHRWFLSHGYPATRMGRQIVYMHRLVMGLNVGDPQRVDHKNRNRLDCRRSNLRLVTHAENNHNMPSRKGSSSKYRGVTWDKQHRRWRASCQVDGVLHFLGLFDDEEVAGEAAKQFRLQHLSGAVD